MALMSLLEGEKDEVKGQVLVKVGDICGTSVALRGVWRRS
jgi:hypothetical protein